MNLQFPQQQHLNCPRCHSNNTKFCYYNNYNLTQPRHFCKDCRRYWTNGGTLRKIPIGGGTRKSTKRSSISNKRPADSSIRSSTATDPPPPLKPEGSAVLEFNCDPSGGGFDSVLRSNPRGSYVDDLTMNLSDGSEKEGFNQLSASDDHTRCGESSDGGDGWTNLSIFRSGSNCR